jgi:hypothetical protein
LSFKRFLTLCQAKLTILLLALALLHPNKDNQQEKQRAE